MMAPLVLHEDFGASCCTAFFGNNIIMTYLLSTGLHWIWRSLDRVGADRRR